MGYHRAFEGSGVYKGITGVPMAVNPLLSVEPGGSTLSVVDLRYYSEYSRQHFAKLTKEHIPECEVCGGGSQNSKPACVLCKNKQHALSAVIDHLYQKTNRPRLWLNEVNVNVSQELFPLTRLDKNHQAVLREFKSMYKRYKKKTVPIRPAAFFKVHLEMPLRIKVKESSGY